MGKHFGYLHKRIKEISEEQVLFLASQNMKPSDIIRQYTGTEIKEASLSEALESVEKFNTETAIKYGFISC